MDPASRARWEALRRDWLRHHRGKTRGDWDLGDEGFVQLLEAAVRDSAIQVLETPRDPWEDAFLLRDSGKWGKAYRDFHRVPVEQVWPAHPARPQ
jgi:hypothetical protein